MAYKRSRATYEADLQARQSPYVSYGTALPPLDPDVRDDGSYVPIWKQEVTDERGRKRLHGAFTGGFSAGYFNTVGSKEGWTPASFVSSRTKRAQDAPASHQQRLEDLMDEEDRADAAEAQRVQTSGAFAGLGSTADDVGRRGTWLDVFKTEGETMGVKLLRRMGWRDGQGVGPKIRRRARVEDDNGPAADDDGGEDHWFAPENTPMMTLSKKNDQKGLGYAGEARMEVEGVRQEEADDDEEQMFSAMPERGKKKQSNGKARGGFGVGILNDTGSDDEDPYEIGPRISYNKVVGGAKKKKKDPKSLDKPGATTKSPKSLVGSKHVFVSKRSTSANAGFRKCHDGRLPLEGFVLSSDADALSSVIKQDKRYPPPEIPKDWKSSKQPAASGPVVDYQSTADAAKASSLDPKSRAALLGEAPLPGKSVFDFLSPAARNRIASASGKDNLPAGRSESAPAGFEVSDDDRRRQIRDIIPALDKDVAIKALGRGVGGWMPYAEDESKRARYRSFLENKAGRRTGLPERPLGASMDDWMKELREFSHAAQIFKPMSGMMASRFTSASSSTPPPPRPDAANDPTAASSTSSSAEDLLRKPAPKVEDPAEAAAKVGMFGPMTRSMQQFHPTRLLCKRFNVRPPVHVQPDPESTSTGEPTTTTTASATSTALPTKSLELVSKAVVQDMLRESDIAGGGPASSVSITTRPAAVVVDVERNQALEAERPGEAVFKAIFGSDDEDD
ncbi:MAG: hypothetical protein M1823_000763 [Watsoniomyces obsoletus]|nr:MAG: hypothetical protein M1823_000763 [Watsoniomyces obsoletus]